MLEFEEDDRIGWDQLFELPIIKGEQKLSELGAKENFLESSVTDDLQFVT